jgi:hypothetical protein
MADAMDPLGHRARGHATLEPAVTDAPDDQQMHAELGRKLPERFDQDLEPLARPIVCDHADHEGARRHAETGEILWLILVPVEIVALVDPDQATRGQPQKRRPHLQEEVPDRVANADDPVDARVQEPHPRHRVEKADIADDTAIGHDADRQAARRNQPVLHGPIAEQMQNVVAAADELIPEPPDRLSVDLTPEREIREVHAGRSERLVLAGSWIAGHRHLDARRLKARERRGRRPVDVRDDAKDANGVSLRESDHRDSDHGRPARPDRYVGSR